MLVQIGKIYLFSFYYVFLSYKGKIVNNVQIIRVSESLKRLNQPVQWFGEAEPTSPVIRRGWTSQSGRTNYRSYTVLYQIINRSYFHFKIYCHQFQTQINKSNTSINCKPGCIITCKCWLNVLGSLSSRSTISLGSLDMINYKL